MDRERCKEYRNDSCLYGEFSHQRIRPDEAHSRSNQRSWNVCRTRLFRERRCQFIHGSVIHFPRGRDCTSSSQDQANSCWANNMGRRSGRVFEMRRVFTFWQNWRVELLGTSAAIAKVLWIFSRSPNSRCQLATRIRDARSKETALAISWDWWSELSRQPVFRNRRTSICVGSNSNSDWKEFGKEQSQRQPGHHYSKKLSPHRDILLTMSWLAWRRVFDDLWSWW